MKCVKQFLGLVVIILVGCAPADSAPLLTTTVPPTALPQVTSPTRSPTSAPPTATMTSTSVPPTPTPTYTLMPTDTPVPPTSTPELVATPLLPSPTPVPLEVSHIGSGQYNGCPFLYEGQYVTDPPGDHPSMDLVNWAMGQEITYLESVYRTENGEVWVNLASDEVLNLNLVEHLVVRILDVPRAIGTWEDGFSTVEVSPDEMYEILIPGIPVRYAFPPYGPQFSVVVGCNQP